MHTTFNRLRETGRPVNSHRYCPSPPRPVLGHCLTNAPATCEFRANENPLLRTTLSEPRTTARGTGAASRAAAISICGKPPHPKPSISRRNLWKPAHRWARSHKPACAGHPGGHHRRPVGRSLPACCPTTPAAGAGRRPGLIRPEYCPGLAPEMPVGLGNKRNRPDGLVSGTQSIGPIDTAGWFRPVILRRQISPSVVLTGVAIACGAA